MKLLALYYAGKLTALLFDEQFFDAQPDVNQMTARLLDVDNHADELRLTEALKAVGATSEQLPVMRLSDIMREIAANNNIPVQDIPLGAKLEPEDLRGVPTYLPEQLENEPSHFALIMKDGIGTDLIPIDEPDFDDGLDDDLLYGEDPFDPDA